MRKLAGPARNDLTVILEKVKAEVHYFDRAYEDIKFYGPPQKPVLKDDEVLVKTEEG